MVEILSPYQPLTDPVETLEQLRAMSAEENPSDKMFYQAITNVSVVRDKEYLAKNNMPPRILNGKTLLSETYLTNQNRDLVLYYDPKDISLHKQAYNEAAVEQKIYRPDRDPIAYEEPEKENYVTFAEVGLNDYRCFDVKEDDDGNVIYTPRVLSQSERVGLAYDIYLGFVASRQPDQVD